MKKTLLIFCLLFPFLALAQDYYALKRGADSLRYNKNFKEAVIEYEKCIDMVLTGKQQLYDSEWINLLGSAMDANKDYPVKYSAMRYGTRAEKMSEKIATLKDMGVKYIFSFYSYTGGSTQGYYSNWPYECNPGDIPTNILVWAINNNVFMQAFNACNTYKPFKLNDPELYNLLKAHTDDLIKEEIKRMILKGHDGYSVYYLKFYTDNSTTQKAPMSIQDFRPMEQNQEPIVLKIIKKETLEKGNDIYRYNIKTHLAQLFLRITEDEKQYYKAINSGAERARVGKLE